MIELIEAAARQAPERPAVITNDKTTSYGELLDASRGVAAGLLARGITRFGIVEDDATTMLTLFAGASLVGAEACAYAPPEADGDVAALAERFDHDIVVSSTPFAGSFTVLAPDELRGAADSLPADPPEQRPHLVLTTGTTGLPKGVRHDWWRITRSAQHIAPDPEQRWLLAYGLHQFAGLQILVHVPAAQATLVAPFPRRPPEGLAAMREHAVTHASATPTFWRFLLAELRGSGDVPGLQQITAGGEAVPDHVLTDLREAFPSARVSQIYAANESGSLRSVRDGRPGLPVEVLDAGDDADVAVKIVDGELWVRSRIGMLGYYGEEPRDAAEWRPTGDLVEIEGDRIMFRGRNTEIINVGGVKVHPLPIEERIGAVPGVALARVYGRANAMTGSIVAVEVVAEEGADTDAVDDAIRDACSDLPSAARPRSIRFVDEIETKGNKIRRTG